VKSCPKLDFRTAKVDSDYFGAVLDEKFVKMHSKDQCSVDILVEIYSDMKILNSMLIVSHGKVLSIHAKDQWRHYMSDEKERRGKQTYFGQDSNEIKSINFTNLAPSDIYDILVEYKGNYLRFLVYYSRINQIKPRAALQIKNGKQNIFLFS